MMTHANLMGGCMTLVDVRRDSRVFVAHRDCGALHAQRQRFRQRDNEASAAAADGGGSGATLTLEGAQNCRACVEKPALCSRPHINWPRIEGARRRGVFSAFSTHTLYICVIVRELSQSMPRVCPHNTIAYTDDGVNAAIVEITRRHRKYSMCDTSRHSISPLRYRALALVGPFRVAFIFRDSTVVNYNWPNDNLPKRAPDARNSGRLARLPNGGRLAGAGEPLSHCSRRRRSLAPVLVEATTTMTTMAASSLLSDHLVFAGWWWRS